mmetsp:Transcript_29037/g.21013  ORF Transcript_29037/g.21013 Transcript_29037/m.21013 type:complete len:170 (+) Transcript_29037:165-674(+)
MLDANDDHGVRAQSMLKSTARRAAAKREQYAASKKLKQDDEADDAATDAATDVIGDIAGIISEQDLTPFRDGIIGGINGILADPGSRCGAALVNATAGAFGLAENLVIVDPRTGFKSLIAGNQFMDGISGAFGFCNFNQMYLTLAGLTAFDSAEDYGAFAARVVGATVD